MSWTRFSPSRPLAIVLALAFALHAGHRHYAADAYSPKEECVRRWTEEAVREDPSRRYAFFEADGVNREELTDWPKRLTCYHLYMGRSAASEVSCEQNSCEDQSNCLPVLEDHNVWEAAHNLVDRSNGEDISTGYGSYTMNLDVAVSIKGDDTRAGINELLSHVQEAANYDENMRFVRKPAEQNVDKDVFCHQFGCFNPICTLKVTYDMVGAARIVAFDLEYDERGAMESGDDTDRAWPARARYRDALFRESTLAELKLRVQTPPDAGYCDALGIALAVGSAVPGYHQPIVALGAIGQAIAC